MTSSVFAGRIFDKAEGAQEVNDLSLLSSGEGAQSPGGKAVMVRWWTEHGEISTYTYIHIYILYPLSMHMNRAQSLFVT